VTYKEIPYRTLYWLGFVALWASATPARADIETVSASGEFTSAVSADQLAAPSETWALSFEVDSNPTAAHPDEFGFDAPFSDFSYTLNGSAVAVTPESIRFYTSSDGGLFTVFFGPESGFFNGMPIPEFGFSGGQVFSGTTSSPTIIPGSYPISDVTYSDSLNYDDEGASGTVTITGASATVPEPSSFWLYLTAVALSLLTRFHPPCQTARRGETSFPRQQVPSSHRLVVACGCFHVRHRQRASGRVCPHLGIAARHRPRTVP
jgi:hypothetical protein